MIDKLNELLDENNEFSKLVDLINRSIQKENDKVSILEKTLIVFMVTKLETFLENKTLEWFETLKNDSANTSNILTKVIKQEIIKDTLSSIYDELKNGNIGNKNKNKLNNFNILLDESYPLSNLDIEFKITLNSHGGNEIKSLLRKIGIENVFETMEQYSENNACDEFFDDFNLTTRVDYEGKINRLINYRNGIVHEDDLGSISYSDLNEFIESVNLLAVVVVNYIKNFYTSK